MVNFFKEQYKAVMNDGVLNPEILIKIPSYFRWRDKGIEEYRFFADSEYDVLLLKIVDYLKHDFSKCLYFWFHAIHWSFNSKCLQI